MLDAKGEIVDFVERGGVLIIHPDYFAGVDVPAFLNELFGWSTAWLVLGVAKSDRVE